ncbi:Os07g0537250, partial [Oryza sativa Japonica Group]
MSGTVPRLPAAKRAAEAFLGRVAESWRRLDWYALFAEKLPLCPQNCHGWAAAIGATRRSAAARRQRTRWRAMTAETRRHSSPV